MHYNLIKDAVLEFGLSGYTTPEQVFLSGVRENRDNYSVGEYISSYVPANYFTGGNDKYYVQTFDSDYGTSTAIMYGNNERFTNNWLTGGNGSDLILGGSGNDLIKSHSGDDIVIAGTGDNSVDGGGGNDMLVAGYGFIEPTTTRSFVSDLKNHLANNGSYFYNTGSENKVIGGEGNDTVITGRGADTLYGCNVYDYATSESWNDKDTLYGGDGIDKIYGDFQYSTYSARISAYSGGGNDKLYGENHTDYLYGDGESISGSISTFNAGDDLLSGGSDNDVLYGDVKSLSNTNSLAFNCGDDILYGDAGNDIMYGDYYTYSPGVSFSGGDDILYGGDGEDKLYGRYGNDILVGGDNGDIYYYGLGDGVDTIYENYGTGGDVLKIEGISAYALDVARLGDHLVLGHGYDGICFANWFADSSYRGMNTLEISFNSQNEVIQFSDLANPFYNVESTTSSFLDINSFDKLNSIELVGVDTIALSEFIV